jgi:hypothetical protein
MPGQRERLKAGNLPTLSSTCILAQLLDAFLATEFDPLIAE